MDNRLHPRQSDVDNSFLSSVAGVPLTRLTRIGLCLVWSGFLVCLFSIERCVPVFRSVAAKIGAIGSAGRNPFDQGFSICMVWLTVEVAVIIWTALKAGGIMLFAKTTPSFRKQIAESLPLEELEVIVEKKRKKALREQAAKDDGKKG